MTAAGAALAVIPARSANASASVPDTDLPASSQLSVAEQLIAPLREGASIGSWRVQSTTEVRTGAITVNLSDEAGHTYPIDLCLRDDTPGAAVPPARTTFFDVFAANGGKGDTPTSERHGLAAMALAEVIRTNEPHITVDGVMTQRDRIRKFGDRVVSGP
jgi:hypothetical protein